MLGYLPGKKYAVISQISTDKNYTLLLCRALNQCVVAWLLSSGAVKVWRTSCPLPVRFQASKSCIHSGKFMGFSSS
jgi:hypothetical protein